MGTPRLYLAGPEVFQRDPLAPAKAKKRLCTEYGFEGVYPLDAEIRLSGLSGPEKAYRISMANEQLIKTCSAIVANMTPFRGPSTDVGTAFEMGFARAQGIPVFAYSNVYELFFERTCGYLSFARTRDDGTTEDPDGLLLEDFGMVDNLMLDGAVRASGAAVERRAVPDATRNSDLAAFEACLAQAKALLHEEH